MLCFIGECFSYRLYFIWVDSVLIQRVKDPLLVFLFPGWVTFMSSNPFFLNLYTVTKISRWQECFTTAIHSRNFLLG